LTRSRRDIVIRSDWFRERPRRLRYIFEGIITGAVLVLLLLVGLCAA